MASPIKRKSKEWGKHRHISFYWVLYRHIFNDSSLKLRNVLFTYSQSFFEQEGLMYHSLHVYIHNEEGISRFLSTDFKQFIEQLGDKFSTFCYIRHWIGGPHIRFRFDLIDEEDLETVESALRSAVQFFINHHEMPLVDKDTFYTEEMLKIEGLDEESLFWTPHGTVVESNYVSKIEICCQEAATADLSRVYYESSLLAQSFMGLPIDRKLTESAKLFYWGIKTFGFDPDMIYEMKYNENKPCVNSEELEMVKSCCENASSISEMPILYENYFKAIRESTDSNHPKYNNAILTHMQMFFNRLGLPKNYVVALRERIMLDNLG